MSQTPDDLPENYKAARQADEPFWITQEKRIQGALGQPCCTLSGIASGFIHMTGEFAVIVHGEDECAACFRHVGPNSHNFFCTGLTEKEFVTGETSAPLEKCLRLVAEEVRPNAIFVLGACPVEVIGDRFEVVVERVHEDYPQIPMIPMHTSGLKVGSQAAMLDWMFSALASLPTVEPINPRWRRSLGRVGLELVSGYVSEDRHAMVDSQSQARDLPQVTPLDPERCLNFIGFPMHARRGDGTPEFTQVTEGVGLTVIANYPRTASFAEWTSIGFAKANLVADRSLYPKLTAVLEDKGRLVRDAPLPTGISQTVELYEIIGEIYGVTDAIRAQIAPMREAAQAHIDAFKAEFGGLKVAIGLRMLNNYEADQVAYQGLGDYRALAELGFDLTLMVQGPPDRRDRVERMMKARNITHPFEMFPEPWNLSEHIGGGRFDVAYMPDHCRAEARKAGVPMIVSRALEPYFEGVEPNLRHLRRMLVETLSQGTHA